MEKTYKFSLIYKISFSITAIILACLIVSIPLSLTLLALAFRSTLTISPEKIKLRWAGTHEARWSDMEYVTQGTSILCLILGGLYGKDVLIYKLKSEKRTRKIPYKFFENSKEIKSEFEKYSNTVPRAS